MEAERDLVTCPRLDIYSVVDLGFEPTLLAHWIFSHLHSAFVYQPSPARSPSHPSFWQWLLWEHIRLLEEYSWKPFIMNMSAAKLLDLFWKTWMTNKVNSIRAGIVCKRLSSSHKENEDPQNSTRFPRTAVWAWVTLLPQGKGTWRVGKQQALFFSWREISKISR